MRALILAAVITLAGCASEPYWVKVAEPAVDVLFFEVDNLGVDNPDVVAFASRDGTRCSVVFRRGLGSARQCVIDHELKHCAGFDHPSNRGHDLACVSNAPLVNFGF